MKKTIIALFAFAILANCTKDNNLSHPAKNKSSVIAKNPVIRIDSACYDIAHNNYNTWVTLKNCVSTDVVTVQYTIHNSGSVIDEAVFAGDNTQHFVLLNTKESGAKGLIIAYVVRNRNDTSFVYFKQKKVSGLPCR